MCKRTGPRAFPVISSSSTPGPVALAVMSCMRLVIAPCHRDAPSSVKAEANSTERAQPWGGVRVIHSLLVCGVCTGHLEPSAHANFGSRTSCSHFSRQMTCRDQRGHHDHEGATRRVFRFTGPPMAFLKALEHGFPTHHRAFLSRHAISSCKSLNLMVSIRVIRAGPPKDTREV